MTPCARSFASARTSTLRLLLWVGVLSSSVGCASVPEADELLASVIEAAGGRDAIEAIDHRLLVGEFRTSDGSARGTVYMAMRPPAEFIAEVELPGYRIWEGSDGNVAWEFGPAGVRELHGEEAAQAIRSRDLHRLLALRTRFESIAVAPTVESWSGRECYVLVATPKEGQPERIYVDRETRRVIGNIVRYHSSKGPEEIRSQFEDHRFVDGVLIAHRVRQWSKRRGNTATVEFSEVRHDVAGPEFDALFELPEAVRVALFGA